MHRIKAGAAGLFLALSLSGCTMHSGSDYNFVSECCVRDALVLSRSLTAAFRPLMHNLGEATTARLVGNEIVKYPVIDYWMCPSATLCVTTSEYVRGAGHDLHVAELDANDPTHQVCVALELYPNYNWFPRKANCPGYIDPSSWSNPR